MRIQSAELARSALRWEDLPREGLPEVAFLGRSNVGKSSLINALLGRPGLARTSSQPGKTRTLNFYLINRAFYFVDLPGLGYARVSQQERAQWNALLERYVLERTGLRGLLHLVDSRLSPQRIDQAIAAWAPQQRFAYALVLTKTDKLSREALRRQEATWRALLGSDRVPIFVTSALRGLGLRELWRHIEAMLNQGA
ncbi:MAG: ribosome biogenesis GTP-binding protein YihA/YsxC [Bacteroidetes bacterium]|nr:ribosome biogenesis GTP-binding protein YihA/YsxC [Rhodothermia bacterium]MCS7154573.1 ribosome biogenesis GTP-binding protein YihA/YsxC [Bacteroidota bacterium]MCX7906290.1 ribosome biogenesis GTP-binding protein YihA/YsxC [Bacteroidota bacterium]MDW8137366.1 ribosome biogenesis GTP-binding protein YihA/YsxC [Bacteroidota bacterium]MDW8285680.1 ribosome biogenesis GTP-binding protein YihA/YsxC [Bacteroidota bacterium]